MKIFIDTGELNEIRRANRAGLIDGVTTNPSLLAKAVGSTDVRDYMKEICREVDGPVNLEVLATEADAIVSEGRDLARIADNAVVKVPLIEEGLVAVRRLRAEGIPVNVTLCFSVPQALLAARAGATYISPFVGRLDDIGHEGMDLVAQIRQIYDNYDDIETQILVASIRHPGHFIEAALIGADVATLPAVVLFGLLDHPLTDRGLERFLSDWKSARVELSRDQEANV